MATTLCFNYSCKSDTHENVFPRRQKIHKHDVGIKQRDCKSGRNTEKQAIELKASVKRRNLSLARSLLTYLDSGCSENAVDVFENLNERSTFVWNVLIRGLTDGEFLWESIHCYNRMLSEGVPVDNFTFPFVIKACSALFALLEGQKIHSRIIKMGLDVDLYICNSLIIMYSKTGCIKQAEKFFQDMQAKDLVSWNSMISGYVSAGDICSSLMCFRQMQIRGINPDRFSMIGILGACSLQGCLLKGKEVHCQVIRRGFESDSMIQTSLIDMYGKFSQVEYSERLFNRVSQRSVILWNAIIGAYALNDKSIESLCCFRRMKESDNFDPDTVTLINLLPSCARMGALLQVKSIHGFAIRKGLFPHLVLETALVDMYGKCGCLNLAKCIFARIKEKNLVSWNAMIATYVQSGNEREALELFHDFYNEPLEPDEITFANILPAYAEIALPKEGKQIHGVISKVGFGSSCIICNSLIHMYAKCGDIKAAKTIFKKMLNKDVVSWNTIIMAYAIHGFGEISVKLFCDMMKEGVKPNESTFVSLLSACSISGMVDEGQRYFNLMKEDHDIDPRIEHYGCMVDLLGRTGNLDLAKHFIDEMPLVPTARIWGSLLVASRYHRNIELAELAAAQVLSLEHNNTGCYVLLSNMYAEARRWEDVEHLRNAMQIKGLQKTIAFSMVEHNGKTCRFNNHDCSNSGASIIYDTLDIISRKIGEDLSVNCISKFKPLDLMRRRANSTKCHSVRLAICFGLLTTSVGNPILVRKNVRICEDCHNAAKKISNVTNREIVVGDSKIYHHFKGGQCSCKDYW